MEYVFVKPYKGRVLYGEADIKKGDKAFLNGGTIFIDSTKPVAFQKSEFAFEYLSRNDDRQGFERKALTDKIRSLASEKYLQEEFIGRFKTDPLMAKFRRSEHDKVWLWNTEFYNADIQELKQILKKLEEI